MATALLGALAPGVSAHVFLKRSEPPAGGTLAAPPAVLRLWFDGPIEPMFITVRVENQDKQPLGPVGTRVSADDPSLLEVNVPAVRSGRYRLFWSVVARDGHSKEGHLVFRVQ